MKLSRLLVLFAAASICLAQDIAKPPVVVYRATPSSKPLLIPDQEWSAMQKMSKEQFQQKIQELTDRMNQVGCPVVLTSAQMTGYLMLLKDSPGSSGTSTNPGDGPGIDLGFRNASGKQIRSIALDAEFLAKRTIYDLQAEKIEIHLTAEGTRNVDNALDHLRHLPLPQRTHPVVLNHLQLEQVTFIDGSVWMPVRDDSCGFSPGVETQIVAR